MDKAESFCTHFKGSHVPKLYSVQEVLTLSASPAANKFAVSIANCGRPSQTNEQMTAGFLIKHYVKL